MAIKIDLLPGYVKLKRDLHRSIAACVVAAGAIAGILLMVLQQRKLDLQTAVANQNIAAIVAGKADTARGEKERYLSASAPLTTAVSFMAAASKTGPQRAALLHLIRQAIDFDAIVSSIDVSDGQNVFIKATVRDPAEYARFVINLRRASDAQGGALFKGLPTASGPGGFANGAVPFLRPKGDGTGQALVINYPVNVSAQGVLLNPILLPPDPVGSTVAATTGSSSGGSAGSSGGSPSASPNPTGPGRA